MPLIWCAVSGHGFGHAAQVVPVLNELHRRHPHLRAILRTTVPAGFFQGRLHVPWELFPAQQDAGCVQDDALTIDVPATWSAHEALHAAWKEVVMREADAMAEHRPVFVLSDIPYVAIEAAARAGVPALGLCSLSWDSVLDRLTAPGDRRRHLLIEAIRQAYAATTLMIRTAPGLPMPAFPSVCDVGPIVAPLQQDRAGLRRAIAARDEEIVVSIGFGGIGVNALPWQAIDALPGFRFIVPGVIPYGLTRVMSADTLPFSFRSIMTSADVVVTKPGYATIVEAVVARTPIVYVRRYNFADEETLVGYLHRYGRGVELSADDFRKGRWEPALHAALNTGQPMETPPSPTGAAEAADILLKYVW